MWDDRQCAFVGILKYDYMFNVGINVIGFNMRKIGVKFNIVVAGVVNVALVAYMEAVSAHIAHITAFLIVDESSGFYLDTQFGKSTRCVLCCF